MVLFVDPSVLIWESFFVSFIGCFWHLLGLLGHLQVHLLVGLEEVRHQLLLELWDLFQTHQAVVKRVEDNENDIGRLVAVDDLVVLVKHQVDAEKREFLRLGANLLDLLLRVVDVLDFTSALDIGRDRQEEVDGVDKLLDRLLGGTKNGILHQVLELDKEFLQLANLVSLFVGLSQVEP